MFMKLHKEQEKAQEDSSRALIPTEEGNLDDSNEIVDFSQGVNRHNRGNSFKRHRPTSSSISDNKQFHLNGESSSKLVDSSPMTGQRATHHLMRQSTFSQKELKTKI